MPIWIIPPTFKKRQLSNVDILSDKLSAKLIVISTSPQILFMQLFLDLAHLGRFKTDFAIITKPLKIILCLNNNLHVQPN